MSKHHLGFLPADGADTQTVADDVSPFDAGRVATQPTMEVADATAAADRAQLERDIAAIERASAALRRADPAMESWIDTPAPTMQKPRPVWLLIGVLWLSTALVTLGAVYAISALVD